jgi:hypothetical protein
MSVGEPCCRGFACLEIFQVEHREMFRAPCHLSVRVLATERFNGTGEKGSKLTQTHWLKLCDLSDNCDK